MDKCTLAAGLAAAAPGGERVFSPPPVGMSPFRAAAQDWRNAPKTQAIAAALLELSAALAEDAVLE